MTVDPVEVLVSFLRSQPEIPEGIVTGDLTEHVTGDPCIYLEHSGGYRVVRDAMDCAHIEYDVYHLDRKECVNLSFLVREKLLEELPGRVFAGALVLDVVGISMPVYYPDKSSREHMYGGEVAVFYKPA